MKQKNLALWLKGIVIGIAVAGLIVLLLIVPAFGKSVVEDAPEYAGAYYPWLAFLWLCAVPCYYALYLGWKIAVNIGANKSFSMENANLLKRISALAIGDGVFFFVGNIALLFLNFSHPGVTLMSLLVVFVAVAISVIAASLSHLVQKAADLQEQSDLTI